MLLRPDFNVKSRSSLARPILSTNLDQKCSLGKEAFEFLLQETRPGRAANAFENVRLTKGLKKVKLVKRFAVTTGLTE